MPDPTAPADAGASSNAATPAADAALVNAASPAPAANVVSGGGAEMPGSTGANPTVPSKKVAKAKKGHDGEPIPVGNETQRKVAAAIAATLPKVKVNKEDVEKAKAPLTGVNAEIKKIIAAGQTQSAAGPKPAELKPPASGAVTAPVQVKAKGSVTPPPA